MKTLSYFSYVILIVVGFASCKSNTNKADAEAMDDVVLEETKEMLASIPAPNALIIMNMLNESGAGYIYDITADPEFVDNYLTQKQKSLGLGIFSADLSYVAIYNQKEESNAYVKAFQKLVDDLQIAGISEKYLKRLEENIQNKDSLIFLVNEAFSESNNYLNTHDQVDIALYVLSGSWIETVYLLEKTIQFSDDKEGLIRLVLRNRQMLDKIVALLENKKESVDFVYLYETLHNIQKLFGEVDITNPNSAKVDELRKAIKEARENII